MVTIAHVSQKRAATLCLIAGGGHSAFLEYGFPKSNIRGSPPFFQVVTFGYGCPQRTMLFPLPAEDLSLDPSFEPTSGNAGAVNVARFSDLQALGRVHLATPVNAAHMYDAAMDSRTCRLTPSAVRLAPGEGREVVRLSAERRPTEMSDSSRT